MPEVAVAGEDHGDITLVGGLDDFGVAHGSTGLDGGGGAGFGGGDEAVGEREEGVGTDDAALERKLGFPGLPDGDARGIHPAHLAGADAEGLGGIGVDDGVGLHVLHDVPAEQEGFEFGRRGRTLGHDLEIGRRGDAEVALLQEIGLRTDGPDVDGRDLGGILEDLEEAPLLGSDTNT